MRLDTPRLLRNRLTTAEILYHLPDYPELLQSFVWQEADLAPGFPALRRFLDYWEKHIEGRLHSVAVTHCPLVRADAYQHAETEFCLH